MKKMSLGDLDKTIEKRKKEVNEMLATNRTNNNRHKTSRVRSKGEREALNQISKKRWEKAIAKGEVKKLAERKWYYDHTTVN